MKKSLKRIGLSLCALLMIAGCSCNKNDEKESVKANINNGTENIVSGLTEGTTNITLQKLYDDLKADLGNEKAAEKLLDIVANAVLSSDTWKNRYEEKMSEKLLELVEEDEYFINGEFSEESLVKALNAELYNITCSTTEPVYGPTYKNAEKTVVDKYLLCDYSDYKEKALKIEVLTELLNEKYVYDKVLKDKSNLLTTKKARLVEYVTISSSKDYSFEFITEQVKKLAEENSTLTLEGIANLWEEKLIAEVEENYNKINTKDDSKGTIMQDFTNGYKYSKEEGLRLKKQEVYAENYYNKVVITNDSKDILNTTLVNKILSDNVLDANAGKTIEINGSYYLVSPLAGLNVDASDIRITDKTNSKYYLVKVEIIKSEDIKEDDSYIYEAVKVLATNSTLVSDSINYYLEQNKNNISVHDEEIYAYLKTQYEDIFVD